ncbi:hypothetical protein SAMN05446037_101269 [Anaerovirgula multivorans]|uniref:Uncharacterized protein n=1 Tax=Anaerovirgula multivorans TaxID=312168 RepID=A0A239FAY3_9FIRM|nr:hypothetical protein [Anaerovirgula multivorans]SNS53322.1 hypothetical protein SAMN05446037_101269 [Anaerovirgula multivorans]
MIKKLIASTVVLLIIGSSGAVAYANPTTVRVTTPEGTNTEETKTEEQEKPQQESLKLITPSRDMVVTDNNLVLAFTAPEGTTVTIDVYYNTSVANNKQNYVEAYDAIEVNVGALQRGWAEVELKKGLNKIDFTAVYKNGLEDVISRIVEVKDIDEVKKEVEKSIANKSSTEALKSIATTEDK